MEGITQDSVLTHVKEMIAEMIEHGIPPIYVYIGDGIPPHYFDGIDLVVVQTSEMPPLQMMLSDKAPESFGIATG